MFPHKLISKVDDTLRRYFSCWKQDHIHNEDKTIIAQKYHGFIDEKHNKFTCEYQIVPMLIGLFWEVEHFAYYKPNPDLKGIKDALQMESAYQEVLKSLNKFDEIFINIILDK